MAKLSKKQLASLQKKLARRPKPAWDQAGPAVREEIMSLGEDYKEFLDQAKTERMAVQAVAKMARRAGFKTPGSKTAGRKLLVPYKDKVIALAVLGRRKPSAGLRIIGAHSDAPRLDLKMHPLYEDQELAFLKTHYYGGIKKYQWLARPLAIHGVICRADGQTVQVHLGDDPADPVFTLLDLLPHLSRKSQGQKKVSVAFEAERMNLLLAGLPVDSDQKGEKVKLAVLQYLNRKYGVVEADLISAELEIVPAGPARDVGLDRCMVGGYGQDDRACCFSAVRAILGVKNPAVTCVSLLVDKEEIGSDGSTGAKSRFLEQLTATLLEAAGEKASYLNVTRALAETRAISADVNAAFDPDFPEVHEKRNAAYLGYGVTLTKYTGSGGKYGASDANPEYLAWLRKVWDRAKVPWQAAGMGKIDEGGGGTIAKLLAVYGMEIVDAGPALFNMHSPFEISHKADIHATVKAFEAFFAAGLK